MTDSPHPQLAHLTPAEIHDLARAYCGGEAVNALLRRYRIGVPPNSLYSLLPVQPVPQLRCPGCQQPLWRRLPRRSAHRFASQPAFCAQCGHVDDPNCPCAACVNQRTEREQPPSPEQQRAIQTYCAERSAGPPSRLRARSLDLAEAIALLAVWRGYAHTPDGLLVPPTPCPAPLTPLGATWLFRWSGLDQRRLLVPSPQSAPGAFLVDSGVVTRLDYQRVSWTVRHTDPAGLVRELAELAHSGCWPRSWREDLPTCRLWLAWTEVSAYIHVVGQQNGWAMNTIPFCVESARTLLRDYSPAQCGNLIARAARHTARQVASRLSLQHTMGELFLSAIERAACDAKASGRKVPGLPRHYRLPRSVFSHVLYDVVLPIGERGYHEPLVRTDPLSKRGAATPVDDAATSLR